MGSLTVRNIGEDVKKRLRLRAAANGRSMEEEVRLLLAEGAADAPVAAAKPQRRPGTGKPARAETAARQILLIIAGGIAAYKSLDLIRRLRERGFAVRVVMTQGRAGVRHAAVGRRARGRAGLHRSVRSGTEFDVGHIRLARDTDLVVVAPATADLMAKMANGHADDLATAVLLATDKPILIAPAMNPRDVGASGDAAQSQAAHRPTASSRSARTPARWRRAAKRASAAWPSRWRSSRRSRRSLAPIETSRSPARRIVITAGPTHEPIDPVRYIANRSSGKQGYAIARAAAAAGAERDAGVAARSRCPIRPA